MQTKETNWGNVNKNIDLNLLHNSPTDYSTRNYIDMPIEKKYYFVKDTIQICIHLSRNKYCVYGFNFQPKYFKDRHIELLPYKWEKLATFSNKESAINCFYMYVKEIIGNKRKIDLQDIIDYLIELKKISEGLSNEL